LRLWKNLTAEQRREIRERERIWQQMSPEQRQRVVDQLLPKWQQLEPERRQAILRRLRMLRELNETQRTARLNDESFLSGLSPAERELLSELSRLRINPAQNRSEPQGVPSKP